MLIDSHCHLPGEKYEKPTEDLIKEANWAGVTKLINIGTSLKDNLATLEVSSKFDNVYSAIAIYPHEDLDKSVDTLRQELDTQLNSSKKIVAVGECGLDINEIAIAAHATRSVKAQLEVLEFQLELAVKHSLPVVLHNLNGDALIMETLDRFVNRGLVGVAHCFSSTLDVAKQFLDRGFYLSFSGMITYKSRHEVRAAAKMVPLDRFLVETDSPWLPPEGFRGKPNEPKHVVEVAKKFAEVRGISFEKVSSLSYSNTCSLFRLNQRL